jgi:MFS family permease
MAALTSRKTSGRIAFTHPDFVRYQLVCFFVVLSLEMQSVAVGWQIYEITKSPLDLGLVGLAQFLPGIVLFLASGHAADRFDRRRLLICCYAGFGICSALLLLISFRGVRTVLPIYVVLVLLGVVRSFNSPARRALLPQLVPEEHFQNAVAWNGSVNQAGTIMGPSAGGLLYALSKGPSAVYVAAATAALIAIICTLLIKSQSKRRPREQMSVNTILAGLRYIYRQKLVLGSISLDLFAVLLGGAVALLPVFAREILKTGPWGLGVLRSAPAVGAAGMAILIAHRPLRGRTGPIMLWCVAGFGLATILFGVSRSLTLSIVALVLVGATDMVSVVIRATLVQVATPDEMRGRVNAVDMIFIGASNEFGQFESGLTAHWFGTVPAVVLGGLGTLVVTGLWAWGFPELRRVDQLTSMES